MAGFAGVMLGIFLFVGMCCWCCKKPSDEFEYEDDEGTALKDAAGGGGRAPPLATPPFSRPDAFGQLRTTLLV